MAAIKKYNGSTWETTTARKYETKSEFIVPPTTIYCNGSNATLSITGNTTQSGTPSPSNPVPVLGVGDLDGTDYKIPILNGQTTTNFYISSPLQNLYTYSDELQSDGTITRIIGKVELTSEETVEYISNYGQFKITTSYYRRPPYDKVSYICSHYRAISNADSWSGDNYITVSQGDTPDRFYRIKDSRYSTVDDFKTYLAQQYANGTPVTIYFVKPAATTETITAPTIPTTDGANSISISTTVQPSEVSATYTGWHDSTVKEWDGTDWN